MRSREAVAEYAARLPESLLNSVDLQEISLPNDEIVIHGAREHNLPRRDRAPAARPPRVHHGPVRLGQVVARIRHALRRGAAPLRRVAVGLRAPVPRADGQARRRLDRGPLAGDLDRPEDDLAQPALDGRHGHRGARLPAAPVRPHRAPALPDLRAADRRASRPSRSSTRCSRCPRARASRSTRRSCAGARASTATCSRACAARASRACASTTRPTCSTTCPALDKKFKHDIAVVVDRLVIKDDLRQRLTDSIETAMRSATGSSRCARSTARCTRTPRSSPAPSTASRWPSWRRATFSFNSPHGACPACTGLGATLEVDPELVVPDPVLSIREGALAPWNVSGSSFFEQVLGGDRRSLGGAARPSLGRALRASIGPVPERHGRRARLRHLQEPLRAQALAHYMTAFEGVVAELAAPLPRDRSRSCRRSASRRSCRCRPCSACGGARLQPEALAVTVGGNNIDQISRRAVHEALAFFARARARPTPSA